MQKIFLHGLLAGILASIAGIIYFTIYQQALDTVFNKIINIKSITGASVFGCMLIAIAFALLKKMQLQRFSGWLNVLITVLSFASIISPFSMSLPLDIESPELFPGLIAPMHFFPALAYFCISPFFVDHNMHLTEKK